MNTQFKYFILLFVVSTVSSFGAIPVIVMDEDGNERVMNVSDRDYKEIILLQTDVAETAAKDQLATVMDLSQLNLHGILVGLGAQGNVGIGPFQIGTGINQQFYFEIQK